MARTKEERREYNRKYYTENLEKIKARQAKFLAENPEKEKIRRALYYKENTERVKAASAKYVAENPEKEKIRCAKYRVENKEKIKLRSVKDITLLSDSYIRRALVVQGFKNEQITPELIELKRITLKTTRLCRQLKN